MERDAKAKELEAQKKADATVKELLEADQLRIFAGARVQEMKAKVKVLEDKLAAAGNPGHGEGGAPPPPALLSWWRQDGQQQPGQPEQQQQQQQQGQPQQPEQHHHTGWSSPGEVPWRTWPEAYFFEFKTDNLTG